MLLGIVGLQAQTIGMRVPDTTVVSGNTIDIPIYADNSLTGLNVMSYKLQLTFNQTFFQPVTVITAGTVSAPFGSPAINTSIPGKITIAGAGTSPLSGQGKFIFIRFEALQPGGSWVNFTGAQNNYFNEGIPAMSFDDGYVNIFAPPSIYVYPDNGTLIKGEQMQFYVSGGTSPFQWCVTNSSVASINSDGLLTAMQQGFTKVVAQDNSGLKDTTNSLIDIRAMRLSIPTNLSQYQGRNIDVPINTTDLSGLNILSGNIKINFNQGILTPLGLIQTGTLLASYPAPTVNLMVSGYVSISFAGYQPLSGSGTLIYVRFKVSDQNNGSTGINFVNGLFNESLLPIFTNGYFSTISLQGLSISPFSGYLVAGQSQQFTLNGGGLPPINWSVNNPLIASINQDGLLSTLKGGNVIVSATDNLGVSATTGNWLVYDTRIIMPDTSICPSSSEFYYPIIIKVLPTGQAVYSIHAKTTYNSTFLTFQSIETTGTLTEGWTYAVNPTIGQIIFSGAGNSYFNSEGIILKLKFNINPGFVQGSNAALQLTNVMLNEGVPNPLVDINGNINGVCPPPNITVSPGFFTKTISINNSGIEQLFITNTGELDLTYQAQLLFEGAGSSYTTVSPINSNYHTGSTTSSIKTQPSLVKGYPPNEVGWMRFDLSSIEDGATINSIEFHGYVNATNYPFWNINPVTNDPITASASVLYNDIIAESSSGYYLLQNETGSYSPGWKVHTLGGNANNDFKASLLQDWFAVGIMDRDGSSSYYIGFDGWNEMNKPYLVVDCVQPYTWLKLNNSSSISGTVPPGSNNQIMVSFNAGNLAEGTYWANIKITSNDPDQPEVLIPCTLNVINGYKLNIKAIIEGPFNGTNMNTRINNGGMLPLSQPYNISPWNYSGTEQVANLPNSNIVDWILVELRDAPTASQAASGTQIARKAAFLLNNGSIVGLDGSSNLTFNVSVSQNLFVVLWHRNHLGVMSASPLTLDGGMYSYDFTTEAEKAYGSAIAHKQIAPGKWGMFSGDGDANGLIQLLDKTEIWSPNAGKMGYLMGDFNLDGQVDNKDKNEFWLPNLGKVSQMPE